MNWVQRLFGRQRLERELDKELRYHIDARIADLIAAGLDPLTKPPDKSGWNLADPIK